MVAGIEMAEDGRATFVAVKEHGWHQKGELVQHDISVQEGMELAHLAGLEYQLQPVYVRSPEGTALPTKRFGIVRKNPFDRTKWESLGVGFSERYTLHAPEPVFAFGEQVIDMGHPLAALGSINGGLEAFAAFRLDDVTIGGVDQVKMFLNIMTSFNGSMATTARVSGIRVVCWNTFQGVMSQTSMPTYKVRHTGMNLEHMVDDARNSLQVGWKGMEAFQKEAELLIARAVTPRETDNLITVLIPEPKEATDRQKENIKQARAWVHYIHESKTVENIKGTAWGVLNAFTEYVDHRSGNFRSEEARLVANITPGSVLDKRRMNGGMTIAKALELV